MNIKGQSPVFVISPIGPDFSVVRQSSDQLFDHVMKPAVDEFGYKALRSDKIPYQVSSQVK